MYLLTLRFAVILLVQCVVLGYESVNTLYDVCAKFPVLV